MPSIVALPRTKQSLVIKKANDASSDAPIYHDVVLEDQKLDPTLQPDEVLVKISAVSFNHRDLWLRKGSYPGLVFNTVLGDDAVGTVIASGDREDTLLNKRVFIAPVYGWTSSVDVPNIPIGIKGGIGVFSEFVKVSRDLVIEAPEHLEDHHAAAWPLAGATAWRAVTNVAGVQKGDNVLITGIGGGVALVALQLCIAKGANVYITSGNSDKIRKALSLGAKGGVNYKSDTWPKDLSKLLQRDNCILSVVLDSGGGDLFRKVGNLLKPGGKLVCYGMTAEPNINFTMREVIKNKKLLGSAGASLKDMKDATEFMKLYSIVPVVSVVLEGFDQFEKGFKLMEKGDHFGKIVMKVRKNNSKL